MAFERVFDLLVLCALFAGGLSLAGTAAPALPSVVVITSLVCCLFLFLSVFQARRDSLGNWGFALLKWQGGRVERWVAPKLKTLIVGFESLGSTKVILCAGGLSVGIWLMSAASVHVWFWAFDLKLPVHAALVVVGFLAFGTALPSAPGFVGAYHYFVVLALTKVYGVDPVQAAAVALVGHAVTVVPVTIVGLPLLLREKGLLRWQQKSLEVPHQENG